MTTHDTPAPDTPEHFFIYALTTGHAVFLPQGFSDDENAIAALVGSLNHDKSFAAMMLSKTPLSVVRVGRMNYRTGQIDQTVPTIIHTMRHLDDLAVSEEQK